MANQPHHVIYLPGIGDHKPYFQPQIISTWKLFGLTPHYHPVIWRAGKWQPKLKAVTELIDELSQTGQVSLVGVSAGATAAFNAHMARPDIISKVVYVCGKLRRPGSIGANYYAKNPAFKESLHEVDVLMSKLTKQDTAKMLSLQPIYDQTVPTADTHLPGVRNFRMLSAFHIPSIFIGIGFYGPVICKFIKASK